VIAQAPHDRVLFVVAEANTVVVQPSSHAFVVSLPRFTVRVVAGPDAGQEAQSTDGRLSVGTAEGAVLRLSDPTVSRYHVDFEATTQGVLVRDLGSTNRTLLSEVSVREVAVTRDVELDIGRSRIRLQFDVERATVATPLNSEFGSLIGQSTAMKVVFASLERTAATNAPVLITGESGTGKELAARAIHQASSRAAGPFEVVDCGGLPGSLIETELFGREGDAADGEREGAFERAEGGTLFLDELGDLPLSLQPKLLRALGEGEIRRVGGARSKQVNVRIVAATNRDLRRHVNSGQFRADLYYRLAVIQIRMPPLRERLEDMSLLVRSLLANIAEDRNLEVHIEPDTQLIDALSRHSWPGNVRELRNYLEQLVILRTAPDLGTDADLAKSRLSPSGDVEPGAATPSPSIGTDAFEALQRLPLRMAKAELLERFERHYVTQLLQATGGNVAEAARRASVDRVTLFRTIRRYGLKAHNP
jgi:two-component system, NtrC family, response regulator GlrR